MTMPSCFSACALAALVTACSTTGVPEDLTVSSGPERITEQQAAGQFVKITDQGTVIKPATQKHFDAATAAAGSDFPAVLNLCNTARPAALRLQLTSNVDLRNVGLVGGKPHPPTKIFDNLYYFSVFNVASYAIDTPEGIIIIDALNNRNEWINDIEPGMRKLGLDPARIKYVVVSHGHGDHFGGAAYLAQTHGARILMSDVDWEIAPTMVDKPFFDTPPPRDMVITDGQKLTLGGTTVTMYITPGHSRGSVSILVPVTDRGERHVAALWGGIGFNFPHSKARFKQYSDSAQRFLRHALAAGADIPLSPHPEVDGANRKIALLAQRGATDPHPFVMGKDGVRRFLTSVSECAQAYREQLTE